MKKENKVISNDFLQEYNTVMIIHLRKMVLTIIVNKYIRETEKIIFLMLYHIAFNFGMKLATVLEGRNAMQMIGLIILFMST